MKIDVRMVRGEVPRVSPALLPNEAAQIARNCDLRHGDLRPLAGLLQVATIAKTGEHRSLFKVGNVWIGWPEDVDVVFAPAYNKNRRFLFTGAGEPKKSDSVLAVTDPNTAPSTTYGLGVPAPVTPLTVTLTPTDPVASAPAFSTANTYAVNDYVSYNAKSYICLKAITSTPAPLPTNTSYWKETTTADYLSSLSYAYTWVTGWGEESAPSPETGVFELLVGQHCYLSGIATPPSGYNITAWRIYRLAVGTQGAEYRFVAERSISGSDYDDTIPDSKLGAAISTNVLLASAPVSPWDKDVFYQPGVRVAYNGQTYLCIKEVTTTPGPNPTDVQFWEQSANLSGLTALSNGVLAAFIENELFFTPPFVYYGWPPAYGLTTEFKIVACGAYNTTLVVLTEGHPYLVDGINPASSALVKLNYRQPCISKRGVAGALNFILYPSPDGLVMIGDQGLDILTAELLTREQWAALSPGSFVGFWTHNGYVCFAEGTGNGYVFDFTVQGSPVMTRIVLPGGKRVFGGWVDPQTDIPYLICDTGSGTPRTVEQYMGGAALTYTWKSKVYPFTSPISMAACRIRGQWATGVTLKVYGDGALIHTGTVNSNEPFRLPDDVYRTLEFELSGTDIVNEIAFAPSMEELV